MPGMLPLILAILIVQPSHAVMAPASARHCAALVSKVDDLQLRYESASDSYALALTEQHDRQRELSSLESFRQDLARIFSREKRNAYREAGAAADASILEVHRARQALEHARSSLHAARQNLRDYESLIDLHISPELRSLLNVTTLPLTVTRESSEVQAIHDALMAHSRSLEFNPTAGVGVLITDGQGRVLMGQRKGSLGAGHWGVPGGKAEPGESLMDAAAREVREETGATITDLRLVAITLDRFPEAGKSYFGFFVEARLAPGSLIPHVRERDKISGRWEWKNWINLPQPLFEPIRLLQGLGYGGPVAPPRPKPRHHEEL